MLFSMIICIKKGPVKKGQSDLFFETSYLGMFNKDLSIYIALLGDMFTEKILVLHCCFTENYSISWVAKSRMSFSEQLWVYAIIYAITCRSSYVFYQFQNLNFYSDTRKFAYK